MDEQRGGLTLSGSEVREKALITPEPMTDGGSEYASAMGTPTKEMFGTPLSSGSSTETLQEAELTPGANPGDRGQMASTTVPVSRQPVAQPYVPPDLPKLLLRDPVEPSEVKLPLDDDEFVPPPPSGRTRPGDGAERTPLLSPPPQQSRPRQGVQPRENSDDSCCALL